MKDIGRYTEQVCIHACHDLGLRDSLSTLPYGLLCTYDKGSSHERNNHDSQTHYFHGFNLWQCDLHEKRRNAVGSRKVMFLL